MKRKLDRIADEIATLRSMIGIVAIAQILIAFIEMITRP